MNFTITPQDHRNYHLLLISCLLLFDVSIILLFDFSWREIVLLLIATPTILLMVLKGIVPIMQKKANSFKKEMLTENAKKEHQMYIALKGGLTRFDLGPNKEHTVYARNLIEASKFYKKRIAPLVEANPGKAFYYVTKKFNNL